MLGQLFPSDDFENAFVFYDHHAMSVGGNAFSKQVGIAGDMTFHESWQVGKPEITSLLA